MLFQIVETVEMIDGMVEEIVGEMTDVGVEDGEETEEAVDHGEIKVFFKTNLSSYGFLLESWKKVQEHFFERE
jgi:H2-forming N5,N10-methylenetetrahydromethanopterin dehydrogenase-like enzyme